MINHKIFFLLFEFNLSKKKNVILIYRKHTKLVNQCVVLYKFESDHSKVLEFPSGFWMFMVCLKFHL